MLQTIKRYAVRGLSSVTAIVVFLLTLPLTLAITLFMLIAGAAAMATVRHRLRKAGVNVNWQGATDSKGKRTARDPQKAAIDGSYTVIEK